MEIIINKTELIIKDDIQKNSSTINYYEIPIKFDSSWNDLTIKAIMLLNGKDKGKEISVINNKIYIDSNMQGIYSIGFVGYKIKNNEKIYQISTDLKSIFFNRGAGEIETENIPLPSPSQWEVYIAQIQNMINGLEDELPSQEQINYWNNKQDKLVSSMNIKTINNESLLGSGNITIEGGGSGGTSNYNELTNKPSINNVTLSGNKSLTALGIINFSGDYNDLTNKPNLNDKLDVSKVKDAYSTTSGDVYDVTYVNTALGNKQNVIPVETSSQTTITIDPNKYYTFGEVASLTITLNTPSDNTVYNEYMFEFNSGTTPTSLTLPNTVEWVETPTIEASKTYQVSIVNNIALIVGV